MQSATIELEKLGPLPSSACRDIEKLKKIQTLIEQIEEPVSDDDARVLVKLFGPDDCFGLAWSLLHLIETAPNWPLEECLTNTGNEWVNRLKQRLTDRKPRC